MKNKLKFPVALMATKGINSLINIVDKKRGSDLSGRYGIKIDPQMIASFKGIDPNKVVFITGTNGKSSSTNLVVHILRKQGYNVVSNLEGANQLSGLATSLAKEANLKGELNADFYVFEVDERWLPIIHKQLPAKNLLIMNLQKDQVQRNGDPDFIMRKLQQVMNRDLHLFLNNDEPRSKSYEQFSDNVTYFGVEEIEEAFNKGESFPTEACPKCDHKLTFKYYNIDGVGKFECENCGFSSESIPDYSFKKMDDKSFSINDTEGQVPYDLPFMYYNYAAATSIAKELANLEEDQVFDTFSDFQNIGGRFETLEFGGKTIKYMRIKQENPDTLQSALNIMASDKENKAVFLGLYPIDDFTPAYTNTFYTYDCDFEPLIESGVDKFYCFSPAVCYDTALALKYAGVSEEIIDIEETEDPERIFEQIVNTDNDNIYLITWLHTFEDLKKYIETHQQKNG